MADLVGNVPVPWIRHGKWCGWKQNSSPKDLRKWSTQEVRINRSDQLGLKPPIKFGYIGVINPFTNHLKLTSNKKHPQKHPGENSGKTVAFFFVEKTSRHLDPLTASWHCRFTSCGWSWSCWWNAPRCPSNPSKLCGNGRTEILWVDLFLGVWNLGVSKNSGTPKWMVYNGKPYQNGWFGGKNHYFWKHPFHVDPFRI